jgi:azurin
MKRTIFSSFIFMLALAFTACGGGDGESSQNQQQANQQQQTVDDGVRTIEVFGTDDMRFKVREAADGLVTGDRTGDYVLLEAIEASPGEEIRITLTTVSQLPPSAMSHNLALVELGTDVDAFARESLAARDNDYISSNFEDRVIVNTAMLGNGESDTITFTVPDEPGEYDYLCTFPGHFSGGMVGKLIVQ